MFERPKSGERAVLVRLGLGAQVDPEDLQEFTQLALSAGAQPVATITGRRERPDPRFFMGSGKADEVRDVAAAHEEARIGTLAAAGNRCHWLRAGRERELREFLQIFGIDLCA